MVPVMVGAIVLSGTRYPARKWAQVALFIGGVVLARGQGAEAGFRWPRRYYWYGLPPAVLGLRRHTGGQHMAFKKEYKKTQGKGLAPYDDVVHERGDARRRAGHGLALDQFFGGVAFLLDHPDLLTAVAKFSFCSVIG